MGLAESLVRRAKLVIAIWILAIIIVAPLAIQLNNVLTYEETAFLPENTESSIADRILQEKFNASSTGMNNTVLIITGIDASSSESREAYYEFKSKVEGKYAEDLQSYYDVYDSIDNASSKASIELVYMVANTTHMLKNYTYTLAHRYNETINQTIMFKKYIDYLREAVIYTNTGYRLLKNNITRLYTLIHGVKDTLIMLDREYVYTRENVSMIYSAIKGLNQSIIYLNNATYSIAMGYNNLFFDITRTYYYLSEATDAYQTGSLDDNDTAIVVYYTNKSMLGPVDPQLVYLVYYSTYPLIGNNTYLVNDYLLANMTYQLMNQTITAMYGYNETMLKTTSRILRAYHEGFINVLETVETNTSRLIIESYTLNESIAGPVQDQVYMYISGLGGNAVWNTKPVIDEILIEYLSKYGCMIPRNITSWVSSEIIKLGPDPSINDVYGVVYNATIMIVGSYGLEIPGLEKLVWKLVTTGYSRELLEEFYINTTLSMASHLPPEEAMLVDHLVYIVVEEDPDALGVLLDNEELLRNTTIETVNTLINASSIPIPGIEGIITRLYHLENLTPRILDNITISILGEVLNKTLTNTTIPGLVLNKTKIKEFINLLINYSIRVNTSNSVEIRKAVYNILLNLPITPSEAREFIERIYDKVYDLNTTDIDAIRKIINPVYTSMVEEMIKKYLPPDTPRKILEYIDENIRWITDKYPITNTSIQMYVVEEAVSLIREYAGKNPLYKDLMDRIDLEKVVSETYRIHPGDEEAVEKIADELVKPSIKSYLLDHMRVYLETMKSSDNTTILVMFKPLGETSEEIYNNALKTRDIALQVFSKHYSGCEAYVTGGEVSDREMREVGMRDVSRVQQYSYIFTLIVLFIVVESVFAVLVPFISIGAAIMLASGIVYILASRVMAINNWATVLMTTTSLGLGIDYTTYFLHRLREMIGKGMGFEEAVAEAIRRARDGILASASTDIIGFAVLMIAWDFPFLRVMGIVVPIAIFSVFLASLTLIPAIVAVVGKSRIFWWPRIPRKSLSEMIRESRIVNTVIRYRGIVIALFIILSIPATYTYLNFQGSHDIQLYLPEGTQTAQAYSLMEEKIGASVTSPTYIILELSKPLDNESLVYIEELSENIAGLEHVKQVYGPTRPYGEPLKNLTIEYVEAFNGTIYVSSDNETVLLRIVLDVPAESDEARSLVKDLRSMVKEYVSRHNNIFRKAYVGGVAASFVDLDRLLEENFWRKIIPVSIILMFLALTFSLRGVIASLITLGIIYVGTTWSIWLSTILFTNIYGKPLLWFLPLVLLVVLLGVGVDYNSFYLVKVRDEMETKDPRKALSISARQSGKLIIGLALILTSAYISLMTTSMWAMREMGFVLTTGVLLIAVSAVYVLSPAIIAYLGDRVWWPFKKMIREEAK